jgi:hypothetical protein
MPIAADERLKQSGADHGSASGANGVDIEITLKRE